jgi:hypothetical protein
LRHGIFGLLIVLFIVVVLIATRPVSAAPPYWFQVGVRADIGSVNVTGASVEIMTHGPQRNPQVNTSFWVGLRLPNNAFIQVGYVMWASTGGYPQRFWEYFPPNTASQPDGPFQGDFEGDEVGPNGTWYTYSFQSNGNVWSAYVNGVLEGSVDLGIANSGGNTPYALAEVEDAYTTNIILGPAEFRNLAYRDTNYVWHNVSTASGYIGYGVGSGKLPSRENIPYGLRVLGVNDWLAGSGLPQTESGQLVWNDGKVIVSSAIPEFPITQLSTQYLPNSCLSKTLLLRKRQATSPRPRVQ